MTSKPGTISMMPGYDVTSCPPAAAWFSEQGKALDTARCGSLSDTPTSQVFMDRQFSSVRWCGKQAPSNLGKDRTVVSASNAPIRYQMCCFISKPQYLKLNWSWKNGGQISHFLTPTLSNLGKELVNSRSEFSRT